jgi:hypothetical protein
MLGATQRKYIPDLGDMLHEGAKSSRYARNTCGAKGALFFEDLFKKTPVLRRRYWYDVQPRASYISLHLRLFT